jgi:aminoglycoside phosphotransferase (APT) family kinase protein
MDGMALAERLAAVLGGALGEAVVIEELTRVPGGASKDTWSFVARGTRTQRRFVLRCDRPRVGAPASRLGLEAGLLAAARRTGVPVPRVVAHGSEPAALGAPFLVMEFVEGETIPRRILRDDAWRDVRPLLAAQCGRILAAIHRIAPTTVPGLAGGDLLAQLGDRLDQLAEPHPAFELGLLWLAGHRPAAAAPRVVHGDFRNGNLIVGVDGIEAVLDWELAHLGDPIEDLGWLCVKAWRFDSALPVGGFGTVEQLVAAYEEAGGDPVDGDALHWWIVFGTLRWGVICIAQTLTHTTGTVRSVELAAIGRRVCEVESDLLDLLAWSTPPVDPEPKPSHHPEAPAGGGAQTPAPPHDVPSAPQLLDSVVDFLRSDVLASTEGRVRFHARVAANVVAMVSREIVLGPEQAIAHGARLAALGVANEAELASSIRAGVFNDRLPAVSDAVRATVHDKLLVANPTYGRDTVGYSRGDPRRREDQ